MDTKLTLKLDKYVIDKAKDYALIHKRSLSRIIESYLKSLINEDNSDDHEEIRISAFVDDMATGVNLPADLDYKKEYSDYLSNKYK
jgi:hypothetical protein